MTERATFEIFQGNDDQHYWRLRGGNGEITAQSEGYTSREAALEGARAVKRESINAVIEVKSS